jgi:hypothetical protein
VRTKIAGEPVRGFVKGAQGALVSRRAGWADRALLLATLVADKSPQLVRGSLAAAKQPAFAGAPGAEAPAEIADVAAKLQVDPKRLQKKAQEADAAAAAFQATGEDRIERDLEAVAAALQSAGSPRRRRSRPAPDEVWWVRIGDKDFGRPEGAEEKSVHAPAELPADEVHRLTIRMKIQQGETETTVLDVTYRRWTSSVACSPCPTSRETIPRSSPDRKSAKTRDHLEVMAATGVFVPVLSGAGKPISGHPFDLTGSKLRCRTA